MHPNVIGIVYHAHTVSLVNAYNPPDHPPPVQAVSRYYWHKATIIMSHCVEISISQKNFSSSFFFNLMHECNARERRDRTRFYPSVPGYCFLCKGEVHITVHKAGYAIIILYPLCAIRNSNLNLKAYVL